MRSAVARLIRSSSASPSRLSLSSILLKSGNAFFSNAAPSDQRHIEKPFKVKEAEPVNVTKPSPHKLLVLGGSGFVGSHVCKEALDKGLVVSSLNRSGKPSLNEPWADKVIWNQGNLLEPASLKDTMDNVSAVVSCVGGFGSNSFMYKINGTANINAIRAAAEKGVKRFVYVSAADFGLVNYLLQGYYEGKVQRAVQKAMAIREALQPKESKASPSQAMVEASQPEVDPEVAAIEAVERTMDEIVMKICSDIYDEVLGGE